MTAYEAIAGNDVLPSETEDYIPILTSFRDVSTSISRTSSEESISVDAAPGESSTRRPAGAPGAEHTDKYRNGNRKVYKYRWWVLFIVWLVTFQEACLFNTWGPIADVSKLAFGWTDGSIALLANWGCIGFTVAAMPLSWAMGRRSLLRYVFLFAAVVCTICTGLRCLTTQPTAATVLINIGHLFNGLSAPVALCAGPVISAKWFPPSERVTSTAIAGMSTTAGVAASFLIGPLLVPDRICNGSAIDANASSNSSMGFYDSCIESIRYDIRQLMIIEMGFSVVVLALVAFTLKTEPKNAPSHSSTIPRLRFIPGLKTLIRNGRYIAISAVYGLINGLFSGWAAVLSLILGAYGVSQTEAGFIGFYSTVAGGVSSIMMARIADRYGRSHKTLILLLLVLSLLVFLALTITGQATLNGKTIPGQAAVYYVTVILGGVFQYGLIPINLELAVELSYPVAEGVTAVFMTFFSCMTTVLFLVLLYIPGIGVLWLNWALIAAIGIGTIIVLFVKPKYARLDRDLATCAAVPLHDKEQT